MFSKFFIINILIVNLEWSLYIFLKENNAFFFLPFLYSYKYPRNPTKKQLEKAAYPLIYVMEKPQFPGIWEKRRNSWVAYSDFLEQFLSYPDYV